MGRWRICQCASMSSLSMFIRRLALPCGARSSTMLRDVQIQNNTKQIWLVMVSKGIWHTEKTDVINKSGLYHSHGSSQISGLWSSCYQFYLVQKVSRYLHISTRHRDWWCVSSLAESWYVRDHYLMLLWQTTRMFTSLHEVAEHNNGNGIFLLSA